MVLTFGQVSSHDVTLEAKQSNGIDDGEKGDKGEMLALLCILFVLYLELRRVQLPAVV